jgi:hypothetical protein
MLQARIANRNIATPEQTSGMPFHILYYMTFLRRTLLMIRAESGRTTTATLWYHPQANTNEILLSVCGGGDSTANYFPGYLTSTTERPCCPMCDEVGTNTYPKTKECRWPYLNELTLPTCTPTADPSSFSSLLQTSGPCYYNDVAGFVTVDTTTSATKEKGKNLVLMLLAKMTYEVAKAAILMKSKELVTLNTGRSTVSLYISASKRSLTVTVPNRLGYLLAALKTSYKQVAKMQFAAAANQYFPGNAATPDSFSYVFGRFGLTLEGAINLAGNEPHVLCSTASNAACTTGSGLIWELGCQSSKYFSGMPWCILGYGKYTWGDTANPEGGDANDGYYSLWEKAKIQHNTKTATGTWAAAANYTDLNFNNQHNYSHWYPLIKDYIQFHSGVADTAGDTVDTADDNVKRGTTAKKLPGPLEKRLNCLFRHYTFYVTLLECAGNTLQFLLSADPGCMAADRNKHRYNCLCRRRTRYTLVSGIPKPKIAGKSYDCGGEDNRSCEIGFAQGEQTFSADFDDSTKHMEEAYIETMWLYDKYAPDKYAYGYSYYGEGSYGYYYY